MYPMNLITAYIYMQDNYVERCLEVFSILHVRSKEYILSPKQ